MNNLKLEYSNCPLCKSEDNYIAYKKNYNIHIHNKSFYYPYKVVICNNCGMIFNNPLPTDKAIHIIYEHDLRFSQPSIYFREKQLNFISRNINNNENNKIFDIGAYEGLFLHLAKKRGYEVSGIEPSMEALKCANEKYGISLLHGFFDDDFVKITLKSII